MLIIHTLVNLQKKKKKNGVFKFFKDYVIFFLQSYISRNYVFQMGYSSVPKLFELSHEYIRFAAGFAWRNQNQVTSWGVEKVAWVGQCTWLLVNSSLHYCTPDGITVEQWAFCSQFTTRTEFLQISLKQLRKMTSLWKKSEWGSNINLINISNDVWMRIVCLSFSMMFQMLKGKLGYI